MAQKAPKLPKRLMNKYIVWGSVFVIPLLYEVCRRVATDHYDFVALALHWMLAALALVWANIALTGPIDIGLPALKKGFICFVCCIGAYCAALNLLFGSIPLADWQWASLTTFKRSGYVLVAISAGFCEEVIYRGYMMTALKIIGQPVWAAMVLSSLSFVYFHGLSLPSPLVVVFFIIAMIWAAIALRTNLLWITIYFHAFWDASVLLIPWSALFRGE